MKGKDEKINLRDFRLLMRAGATWISMNIDNDLPPAEDLWFHLEETKDEDCLAKPDVSKVFFVLKFIFMFEGPQALRQIMSGSYESQKLLKLKVDETGSRESF
jgi:hypothetical protein